MSEQGKKITWQQNERYQELFSNAEYIGEGVTAVALAARRDLLLQIAQDLHGWAVINPEGNMHWPMVNILLGYDRNYLPTEDEEEK